MKKMKYTLTMENGDKLVMEKEDFTIPFTGTQWYQGEKQLYSLESTLENPKAEEPKKGQLIDYQSSAAFKKHTQERQKMHDYFHPKLIQRISELELAAQDIGMSRKCLKGREVPLTKGILAKNAEKIKIYQDAWVNLSKTMGEYTQACPTEFDQKIANKLFQGMIDGKYQKANLSKQKQKGELIQFPK